MSDLIDRLREYASTRKGELAELITEAADALEKQTCDDDPRADVYYLAEKIGIHRLYALVVELRGEPESCDDSVSRADVIELVKDSYYNLAESMEDTWAMVADVEALPAVQPLVIHCTDCEDWLERQSILGFTISELPAVQRNVSKHYPFCHCGADMRKDGD